MTLARFGRHDLLGSDRERGYVNTLSRQGQRLLQIGVGLLLFASFEGFVIPYFGHRAWACPHTR